MITQKVHTSISVINKYIAIYLYACPYYALAQIDRCACVLEVARLHTRMQMSLTSTTANKMTRPLFAVRALRRSHDHQEANAAVHS